MTRVLQVVNRMILGGVTSNAVYLTADLRPEFETHLVSGMAQSHESDDLSLAHECGVEPEFVPAMRRELNPARDAAAYRHLVRILERFRPDVVHTHASKPGALARLAAHRHGVPVILHTFHGHTFHSYFDPARARFFLELERWLARRTSRIVAISPAQRDDLVERFRIAPADRVTVVPIGIDVARFADADGVRRRRFRGNLGVGPETVLVGIVGRVVSIKNHDLFLDAWDRLRRATDADVRALVVGDGDARPRIEARARELGFPAAGPGSVAFPSWMRDIEDLQAGLDIGVLTSHNEGTPVSLIESQAAGRPVVATAVGGVVDTVLDGETGYLVAPGDADALARRIGELVGDAALRERMGKAGRRFVGERYDRARLARDMAELYRTLLAGR